MTDVSSAYSIQGWLESCPQGYLDGTVFGHAPGEQEIALLRTNPVLHEDAIRTTVQLVVGERAALAASAGLINAAPDEASKRFLATQTLDEARHVEVFTQRLFDLGVRPDALEATIREFADANLVRFADVLLEKVDRKDFLAGVVGQNVVLESLACNVFEMLYALHRETNPKFAHTLAGTIADDRRHVAFGDDRLGALVATHPDRRRDVERMQRAMASCMLAAFADVFRSIETVPELARLGRERRATRFHGADLATLAPADMQQLLAATVLNECKTRLGRVGLAYQPPVRP